MGKLSSLKINQILTQFADENPQIELTESQIQDAIDLFDRLMNEKVNQTKNAWEQEALVTDIAIGFSYGETTDFIFRQHADNKHLDFFDTFLAMGETKKIEKVLKENSLPSSVLKGLKPNQNMHLIQEYNGDTIEVKGIITFSPDGEKEQNDYLDIYMNGKLIYSWHRNAIEENVEFDDTGFIDYESEKKQDSIPIQKPRKDGKPRKSVYVGSRVTTDNIVIEESYDRLGRRRLQYAAGTVINGVKVGGRTVKQ